MSTKSNAIPAAETGMKIRLDEITMERHSRLFVKGDYANIVKMINRPDIKVKHVIKAFETGVAKEILANGCTSYYATKATKQEAQKALTEA